MKKIYLLILFILTLFTSCEKENTIPDQKPERDLKTVNIQETLNLLPSTSVKTKGKQSQTPLITPEYEKSYYLKIAHSHAEVLVVPAVYKNTQVISRILFLKVKGKVEGVIFNQYPDPNQADEYYSGEIGIFNLDGEFLRGFKSKNGVFTSELVPKEQRKSSTTKASMDGNKCSDHGECTSSSVCILCQQYLAEVVITAPKTSQPESIEMLYIYPSYEWSGDSRELEPSIDYGTGMYGGGSGGTTTTPTEEEDKIVVELDGEALCVYLKLKNLDLFKKTIGVFDNNDNYTLNIIYGDCDDPADACTNGGDIENGNVTIKIENIGYGSLDLAALLLHEGIHAEIYKYVEEYKKGIDPSNRANLLHYYFYYKAQNGLDLGTTYAQHQYMADNFVKPIAQAIQQLDGYKYTLDYYMGFGWDGLRSYGFDGYWDNGKWVNLDKSLSSDYYKKQQTVLLNTIFNKDCSQ